MMLMLNQRKIKININVNTTCKMMSAQLAQFYFFAFSLLLGCLLIESVVFELEGLHGTVWITTGRWV